jgi:hypothetical protein
MNLERAKFLYGSAAGVYLQSYLCMGTGSSEKIGSGRLTKG